MDGLLAAPVCFFEHFRLEGEYEIGASVTSDIAYMKRSFLIIK